MPDGLPVCVCIFWGMGGIGRGSRFPEFPSVWPPYTLGALETLNVGEQPPLPTRCHDDNKHVSRHTPEQSAIRFTVHEIWQRFYWPKDLSVIIYRLLPRRLWCQRRFLHPRENQGESDRDGGEGGVRGLEMSARVWRGGEWGGEKVMGMREGHIHPLPHCGEFIRLREWKCQFFSSLSGLQHPPPLLPATLTPIDHMFTGAKEGKISSSVAGISAVSGACGPTGTPSMRGRPDWRDPCGRQDFYSEKKSIVVLKELDKIGSLMWKMMLRSQRTIRMFTFATFCCISK